MHPMLQVIVVLPIVGALIGYVCKWLAIKMMFGPAQFVGVSPFGWQGIVQHMAPKFASNVADTVIRAGIEPGRLLARIAPRELAKRASTLLQPTFPALIETIFETVKPGAYALLPETVRAQFASHAAEEATRVISAVFEETRREVVAAFDVRALIIHQLSGKNADNLAALFKSVGRQELRVVIRYGALLGLLIGIVEVFFYAWLDRWWILPLVGALDGFVNNWLALQMIFRPRERTVYLGIFPFQGLFHARQEEIAGDYGRTLAETVLTPRDAFSHLGAPERARLRQVVTQAVEREVAPMVAILGSALGSPISAAHRARIQSAIAELLLPVWTRELPALEAYMRDALAIEATIETELKRMPKDEFELVLRGIFAEDEATLVGLGAVLGGAIGLAQSALLVYLR